MLNALRVLNIHASATKREIVLQFITLDQKGHPDKWKSSDALSKHNTSELFKHVTKTRDILLGN